MSDIRDIDKTIFEQIIEETFLHEVIHSVDLIYNGGRLKEETVRQLAQGLYQVLNDNGMLVP